ncbi:hypothetical protein [Taibaiella soli]|uniref:GNAT family N-acetyltransferase n=1 Tax=Taibaiella soli TaxID=1649169 RepID=A0A2W2B1G1_9BACT|nr:hypothetical protein [Taibaiella soli]PZF74084.1 hypothetical protein DN068_05175 [Taibaiella soli]
MIKIRAFRAIDDYDACQKFILGHQRVLEDIGVKKVTSSKNDWAENPAAFVIIVESLDGSKIYGGSRVHVSGGTQLLPIEEATGFMDKSIYDIVNEYAYNGTGEICGLWSSKEVAGLGIGSMLIPAGVAIIEQIKLDSLFALCAPYTVKMVENVGFDLLDRVGNKGTFYYPKLDLVATAMVLEDPITLFKADPEGRQQVFTMRQNLNGQRVEVPRCKELEIDFQLEIPNLDAWFKSGILKKNLYL